jgi:hypothetical protein
MREHHKHFGGWIIYWDDRTDHGFRFWFGESICEPISSSQEITIHHIDMFSSVEDGLDTCEQLILAIIDDQAEVTYRKVSDYHHSRNSSTATDTGNTDYIPF